VFPSYAQDAHINRKNNFSGSLRKGMLFYQCHTCPSVG